MKVRVRVTVIVIAMALVGPACGDDDTSLITAGATTTVAGETTTTKVPDTAAVTTTTTGGGTSTTKAPPETITTVAGTTTSVVVTTSPVATTSGFVTLPTLVTIPPGITIPTDTLDYTAEANFGNQSASAGFAPDPIGYAVVAGGAVDVSYLGGGCVGFASVAPDIDFQWSGSTGTRLRFLFFPDDATADPVLIINAPDGSWVCNDDYPPSRFPVIDFPTGPNGHYDIWVGAYAGGLLPGTLYVTELAYNPVDAKPPGA